MSAEGRRPRYWESVPLDRMTRDEWEALCDGCGKCCLNKLEDEDTGRVHKTDVACRLLDLQTCRCSDYARRRTFVPECVQLSPSAVATLDWLPASCAYVRVARGLPLPRWHHLVSGDAEAVHRAGASVRGWAVSETEVDDLEDRIID